MIERFQVRNLSLLCLNFLEESSVIATELLCNLECATSVYIIPFYLCSYVAPSNAKFFQSIYL